MQKKNLKEGKKKKLASQKVEAQQEISLEHQSSQNASLEVDASEGNTGLENIEMGASLSLIHI